MMLADTGGDGPLWLVYLSREWKVWRYELMKK